LPSDLDIVLAIVAGVERYCAAHPGAGDTAEGVSRVWLSGDTYALADVESALELLVARKLLERRDVAHGPAIYFCRKRT
jgi:hypothetical protein